MGRVMQYVPKRTLRNARLTGFEDAAPARETHVLLEGTLHRKYIRLPETRKPMTEAEGSAKDTPKEICPVP